MTDEKKDPYAAVTHITVRCRSELDPTTSGLRVTLVDNLKYTGDTVIFYDKAQPQFNDDSLNKIAQLLTYSIIKKLAAEMQPPPSIVFENVADDVLPAPTTSGAN